MKKICCWCGRLLRLRGTKLFCLCGAVVLTGCADMPTGPPRAIVEGCTREQVRVRELNGRLQTRKTVHKEHCTARR